PTPAVQSWKNCRRVRDFRILVERVTSQQFTAAGGGGNRATGLPSGSPGRYHPLLRFFRPARVDMTAKKSKPALTVVPATPAFDPTNPFIVQSDRSVLVEVDNPKYTEARDELAPFAELEKSPEHIHTYRISNLSLWNAAAAGFSAADMLEVLQQYTELHIPPHLPPDLAEAVSRYGRVRLERIDETKLKLVC